MSRVSLIQNDFSSGEVSPLVQGRIENPRYKSGVALMQNMIAMLQGPTTRRAGTAYVANAKSNVDTLKLIPFKYSQTEAYMLEFGDHYVRFYTNRGQVQVSPGVPFELVTPYSSSDLSQLKYCQSLDVLYLVHPNFPPYTLNQYSLLHWTLAPFVFNDGPYFNQGEFIPNNVTITNEGIISGVIASTSNLQFGTVFTLTTGIAVNISNVTNNGFGLIRVSFDPSTTPPNVYGDDSQVYIQGVTGATEANGTWRVNQIDPWTYDLQGSTFTAPYTSGGTMAPGIFVSTDVGRLVRIGFTGSTGVTEWCWATIQVVTNPILATCIVSGGFIQAGNVPLPTPDFNFGVYSSGDGYPSCVAFHEDRLYFGAPGANFARVDGSVVSDYSNFGPTTLSNVFSYAASGVQTDASAVAFILNSHDGNPINDLKSDELGMPLITAGGPWILRPSILSEPITPTSISAKKVNNVGSANIMATTAQKATIFLEQSTRKIRELTYFYQTGGFRSIDLTELAEHLPDEGITTELVYQSVPVPIIWCGRADGTLIGITYDRQLDGLRCGWHRHYLGGSGDASGNPPVVQSLAVIPSPDATTDDVWMIVRRFINGNQVQYVEYLTRIYQEFDEQQNAFFVDCGGSFNNPVSGFTISNANPANVFSSGHGLTTGNIVRFNGVEGLTDADEDNFINGMAFVITVVDSNNFTLNNLDTSALTPYDSGTGTYNLNVSSIQLPLVAGASWLEGETVDILGDGSVLTPAVVGASAPGVIELSYPAGVIQFGEHINARFQGLIMDGGSRDGTSLGKNRRVEQLAVMVENSNAFMIGDNFDEMEEVSFRDPSMNMDQATPLFTGIQDRVPIPADYDLYNQIAISIPDPTPFTLIAVMPQMTTYDKE